MSRNRLTLGGLLAILALAASALTARETVGAAAPSAPRARSAVVDSGRTIWDSVYTTAQARRGERLATQVCSACHSAAEWSRSEFLRGWNDRTVADLFEKIHGTMPKDSPGSLTRQQYVDVITYMLRINEVPAGAVELGTTDEALQAVRIRMPRP